VEPDSNQSVLVLSEKGYGKRTKLNDDDGEPVYRITNRGGKGVKTINLTEKTGDLVSVQAVNEDDDLMIINKSGITIRTAVAGIRLAGRATQGVRIINLREGDQIASVVAVPRAEDETPSDDGGSPAPDSAPAAETAD
jgi:DNA gyrase subunit A